MKKKLRHEGINGFLARGQRVLTACAWAIAAAGLVYFGWLYRENWNIDQANQQVHREFYEANLAAQPFPSAAVPTAAPAEEAVAQETLCASATEPSRPAPSPPPQATASAEDAAHVLQPQFESLHAQNNDLIGWLKMGGDVDLPVVWRDNSYYMDHDFYGNSSKSGAIFLDARNQVDLSDGALVVYGHNMKSGAMFGNLDFYRQLSYLRQHPIISLQSAWEESPRKYVLLSLFDASMNSGDASYIKITRFNFEDAQDKQAFIDAMRARSLFDIPLAADASDQLLTLVTCSYSHNNGRFLLVARALRDGEQEECVMDLFAALK